VTDHPSLNRFTKDLAEVIPAVDCETTGQDRDGPDSEDNERQFELLLDHLDQVEDGYAEITREMRYPDGGEKCDLVLPSGVPVEAKLIRYWRATVAFATDCSADRTPSCDRASENLQTLL
jgi:hypothetical protein